MSYKLNLVPRSGGLFFGRMVGAAALMSTAGLFVTTDLAAQTLQPSWVHRGAKVLAEIAASTTTALSNTTMTITSTVGTACHTDPNVAAVNAALNSFSGPNGPASEKVDCTQPYYTTNVTVTGSAPYSETYVSTSTIPAGTTSPASPPHGTAIYFPAIGGTAASLLFEPD
jgi:hypothetical protein